jgi:hypothetical protein
MKATTKTRTKTGMGTISRVGALSTSYVALLSALGPKLQQHLKRERHSRLSLVHGGAPQPAGSCVMLVMGDMGGGSHDILS